MLSFEPEGKTVLVTGAGSGIGAALAQACHGAGARAVIVADLNMEAAGAVAAALGARAVQVDVGDEAAVREMVLAVESEFGPIDLYCSNAGVLYTDAPDWTVFSQSAKQWETSWRVNVMAHVHACRAVLPAMLERGEGAMLITASAAGLLSQIGDAAYSTTKHAAVGFAESLAIAHGDDGVYVGVLCPQGVDTAMIRGVEDSSATLDGLLGADDVAARTLEGMREGRFMIRPHPQVADYVSAKASDHDRWVGGMRKLRRKQRERTGRPL